MERRSFLTGLVSLGTVFIGGLLSVPLLRFFLFPVTHETSEITWSELGSLDNFSKIDNPIKKTIKIEQIDGWRKLVSEKAVYILRSPEGKLRVLSPVCPHLGCMISWDAKKSQFLSPCHGGIFSKEGALLAGPPRRAMDELPSKTEDGKLWVQYRYFRPLIATKETIA